MSVSTPQPSTSPNTPPATEGAAGANTDESLDNVETNTGVGSSSQQQDDPLGTPERVMEPGLKTGDQSTADTVAEKVTEGTTPVDLDGFCRLDYQLSRGM